MACEEAYKQACEETHKVLCNDQVMLPWNVLKLELLTVENLQQPQVLLCF